MQATVILLRASSSKLHATEFWFMKLHALACNCDATAMQLHALACNLMQPSASFMLFFTRTFRRMEGGRPVRYCCFLF